MPRAPGTRVLTGSRNTTLAGTTLAGSPAPDRATEWRDRSRTRDHHARQRDRAAAKRDRAAAKRDGAAARRDRAARLREASLPSAVGATRAGRARHPRPALAARAARLSALERDRAARDRAAAAKERRLAAGDRRRASADRRAREDALASAAVDSLTGAYRREVGFSGLRREIARANRTHQPLAVAFVDVDGLKATNDTQGHAAGDQRLRAVVAILKRHLRPYDLVFRYGGDEFVCVLAGLTAADLDKRFAAVRAGLTDHERCGSVTVGLAELRRGDSVEDLLARADAALYEQRRHAADPDAPGVDRQAR